MHNHRGEPESQLNDDERHNIFDNVCNYIQQVRELVSCRGTQQADNKQPDPWQCIHYNIQ